MRYLSEEWLTAADAAVNAQASTAPTATLVVDQHVDGAIAYRVRIGRDACSIKPLGHDTAEPGDAPELEADATFRQTLATARAVAQGTTDAHQAFLLGHITFVGDVQVLIEQRDSFAWLESVLSPVLAQTTFD